MTKIIWGVSGNSHDAALSVFQQDGKNLDLKFASHSERFSREKNDPHLHDYLIGYAEDNWGKPDEVVWYEKPFKKTLRQLFAGQGWNAKENDIKNYLSNYGINAPISYVDHHRSHAAGGYFTSGFKDAAIVVIDSIGEFETLTIWRGEGNKLKRVFSQRFPHSIGLWYSAMTDRIGLKAQEDEYILMGMAAYGDKYRLYPDMLNEFVSFPSNLYPYIKFNKNFHRGAKWWRPELTSQQDMYDIAAATQRMYEHILNRILLWAKMELYTSNLVLMGGCALNCAANSIAYKYFKNVWIMPNPGDSGSAIGSVLAKYNQPIEWKGPFLGYEIEGEYPVDKIINELLTTGIVGVANGKAEFGPRALGNRSLLADPRGPDIKRRVNDIKQRQQFRPFAPAILAEHAATYFNGHTGPYMQFTSKCAYPSRFPAIVHKDKTSRVQTVTAADNPGFRRLLEEWYNQTGCPMLLNTSLNIKGEPIVNTFEDAISFEKKYNVRVF